MSFGKRIYKTMAGENFCLGELVVKGKETDPIVEIGRWTLNALYHIIIVPAREGSFNQDFNSRTHLTAETIANFQWWHSIHQKGLKALLIDEFVWAKGLLLWNVSIVPYEDGRAISFVFGDQRAMELVYEKGLRTNQPKT